MVPELARVRERTLLNKQICSRCKNSPATIRCEACSTHHCQVSPQIVSQKLIFDKCSNFANKAMFCEKCADEHTIYGHMAKARVTGNIWVCALGGCHKIYLEEPSAANLMKHGLMAGSPVNPSKYSHNKISSLFNPTYTRRQVLHSTSI